VKPRYREEQAKTQPVILEPEHDGLRVLARIIARSLIQKQAKSKQGFDQKQTDIPPGSVAKGISKTVTNVRRRKILFNKLYALHEVAQ
jgi:hypothetical protein